MRQAAKRPETRTVTVKLKGAFEGWECTAKADFRAGLLTDLMSGEVDRIVGVLGEIIIDHNFPNEAGDVAASIRDVDPYEGVIKAGEAIFDALGKLPNR